MKNLLQINKKISSFDKKIKSVSIAGDSTNAILNTELSNQSFFLSSNLFINAKLHNNTTFICMVSLLCFFFLIFAIWQNR